MTANNVTWDGKNLAVIQMLLHHRPRAAGCPCYEVDEDWNLSIMSIPVIPGQHVTLLDNGGILISEPVTELMS